MPNHKLRNTVTNIAKPHTVPRAIPKLHTLIFEQQDLLPPFVLQDLLLLRIHHPIIIIMELSIDVLLLCWHAHRTIYAQHITINHWITDYKFNK